MMVTISLSEIIGLTIIGACLVTLAVLAVTHMVRAWWHAIRARKAASNRRRL